MDTIALALNFTRSVDSLVMHTHTQDDTMSERRDEVVFTERNLDRVRRRIEAWERVIRLE